MTKEEILEEFNKCADDPVHFIKNYIKIIHPLRGQVPFDLYNFQTRIVNEIDSHRFNIIKKFRQAGVTTIMCAYALWFIIFQEKKNVMVVSIGDRESTSFLGRVVDMYDELPSWLKPGVREKNKHNLVLNTASRIRSQPAGAGRGESVSLLIVDEAAFIPDMAEFWAAMYPTLSTGGNAVLLSTVNGMSNLYYEIYKGAERGENTFNVIDIFWREHPEYTEKWAEEMRPALGDRMWSQEYECDFLGTGDTFINADTLRRMTDNTNKEFHSKYNNRMRVFSDADQFHTYVVAVDASFGREKDYSAFHIINMYNGEQVAEFYSNNISLKAFAKIIHDEATRYNTAYVSVERNGLGLALIEELWDELEYENMWCDEKGDIGLLVTTKNRDIILSVLEEGLRTSRYKINSSRTVKELQTFIITENGKMEADEGYNDDLVMSLAIGMYCINQIFLKSPIAIDRINDNDETKTTPSPLSRSKYRDLNAKEKLKEYMKWVLSD
tara:strand:- start:11439 stop:12926 length:1488 start_codon:yes stop_codon:yes gene_type:complete